MTFGIDFNTSLADVKLPKDMISLTFGKCFNQPLTEVKLPAGLQQMTFGDNFNRPFAHVLKPREYVMSEQINARMHVFTEKEKVIIQAQLKVRDKRSGKHIPNS